MACRTPAHRPRILATGPVLMAMARLHPPWVTIAALAYPVENSYGRIPWSRYESFVESVAE